MCLKILNLILIRHAESVSNELKIWTGQRDYDLSARGEAELIRKCGVREYPKGDIYFCSPLLRCKRTLEIIYPNTDYTVIDELAECSLGELEGKPYTDLNADVNYLKWLNEPNIAPTGGESFFDFKMRVLQACEKLLSHCKNFNNFNNKKSELNAVAVIHGNVMRAILSRFAMCEKTKEQDWPIPNCGGYILENFYTQDNKNVKCSASIRARRLGN